MSFASCIIHFLCLLALAVAFSNDPYRTLGVSKAAGQREIKKAYKKMVMEWHPDRNTDPAASDKFVQIQKAYEVLSDPQRKERYDRYGSFDEPQSAGQYQQQYHDYFDFGFGGGQHDSSFFENHRITYRMYMNNILERSHTQPFIIFGYSSYCTFCYRLEPTWKSAVNDLEALGYGIGTVNALTDGVLLEKLRVQTLPSILVVVEGRVVHYRHAFQHLSAKNIRLFARDVIPTTFLQRITSHNGLRRFLDQWEPTNKVSILMLGAKEEPRLRYLLTAMKYSHFARFAYVHLSTHHEDMRELRVALNIGCTNCENVIVFKENPASGEANRMTVTTTQFSSEQLATFIEKNKFLTLPRLSSMQYFDDLCPTSSRSLRHYCVILPVVDDASEAPYVDVLRSYLEAHPISEKQRLKVAYVYVNRQSAFFEQFAANGGLNASDPKRSLLVLWRNEYVKVKYAWLPSIISTNRDEEFKTFELLKEKLHALDRGSIRLDAVAKVVNLVDENEASWIRRVSRHIVRMAEMIWFYTTKEESLPVLCVVATGAVILIVGCFLSNSISPEKQYKEKSSPQPSQRASPNPDWHPEDPKTPPKRTESVLSNRNARIWRDMEPIIHELKAETYFGLIRLLKPGCRSLVVLVDKDTKDTLLPQFARHVWPLRNNKTFSFGYLLIDKNLHWFRNLLEQILPQKDEDTTSESSLPSDSALKRLRAINPKHTIGTILVLCGYKLYFSMYHPMYKIAKAPDTDDDLSSSESDGDGGRIEKKKAAKPDLNAANVLNGFPNFLDRLLEGSVPRFYIPEWPATLK
uniref:DnaJ homolog subfamily C member 16 n=1 Tax=Panagrellus redivivus TaxID=6233 RepID=A0A7E4VFG4_PANRE